MPCSVCQHPSRQAIDEALLADVATLAQLSAQYQLSTSALHRHKQHLLPKVERGQARIQAIVSQSCLTILNSFLATAISVSRTVAAEGNHRLALQAVRQGTAILKFMHKLGFPLTPDTILRLLALSGWPAQDSLLPTDPQLYLASGQTLAQCLFAPCPEPGSGQDNAPVRDQAGPDLLTPAELLSCGAEQEASLDGCGCGSQSARREKSGKKPGKKHGNNKNKLKYHKDTLKVKNTGKCSPEPRIPVGRQQIPPLLPGRTDVSLAISKASEVARSWVQELEEGRLDVNILPAIGAGRPFDLDQARSGVSSAPPFLPAD